MDRQYLLHKSPEDPRDYNITKLVMQAAPEIEEVTTSQYCGAIYDQGYNGFCWTHMMAAIINNFLNRHFPGLGYNISPLYIAAAIKQSEYTDYPAEEGDTIRAAVKGVQKLGAVAESIYPYFGYRKPLRFPEITPIMKRMAERFRVGPYARITTPDEMAIALNAGNALALGLIWMSSAETDCWLDMPNGSVLGGHAVAGFDISKTLVKKGRKGWVKFQNSHGKDYGEKGFGYVSFDYLKCVADWGDSFLIDCFAVGPDLAAAMLPAIRQSYKDGAATAIIDGHPMLLDQPAIIMPETGRFVVPMRKFGEQSGYTVEYFAGSKVAEFTKREDVVK